MDSGADSKVGAYPNADQPNQFGTFYRDFFTQWKTQKTREACWPDFIGAIGIAKANADDDFIDKLPNDLRGLQLEEMAALMWEAWALTVRLNWWNWKQAPEIPIEITR